MKPDIALNPDLLRLVENKNVHLVGPAPYLKGQWRGAEIDKADIIVRPNEIIPLRHLRRDYGSRTDIFFCNFGTPWMAGIKRKIALNDHNQHYKKIKLVVGSAIRAKHTDTNYLSWSDNYISDVPHNFQEINEHNLPFYWIGVKDYKTLYSQVQAEFSTGLAAVLILTHYPIKKLTISGFTFFLGGNTLEDLYCEGHWDEIDAKGRAHGFSAGHGTQSNIRQVLCFKTMCERDNRIKIDDMLKKLLTAFK